MPTELPISIATLQAFAFVLARIAGAVVFVPIPGVSAAPAMARVVLVVSVTVSLFPAWPVVQSNTTFGAFAANMLAEAVFGLAIGLMVACILEAFTMAAQMLSVQAGFSYASTIDPTTQADSTVLLVLAQLTGGLLFFALGLDHRVLLAFSNSLSTFPPGSLAFNPTMGYDIIKLAVGIFTTAFRLVVPLLALLLMLDLSLGLMGRLNAQLQLMTIVLPVKTLVAAALLSWSVLLYPRAIAGYVETAFSLVSRFTGHQ